MRLFRKAPNEYGPFVEYHEDDDPRNPILIDGRANNKIRQRYVLYKLYENGAITYDEYQEYLNTPIIYTDSEEYLREHPEDAVEQLEDEQKVYSWMIDAIYYEAANFLMEELNIEDQLEAINRINSGGYKIYSRVDERMQEYVEEKFLNLDNIVPSDSVRKWDRYRRRR